MTPVSRPILEMIVRWVTAGELEDQHEEFFIAQHKHTPEHLLWQTRSVLKFKFISL